MFPPFATKHGGKQDYSGQNLSVFAWRVLDVSLRASTPKHNHSNGWLAGRCHRGERYRMVPIIPVESTHFCWEHFGEKQHEVLLALCPQHGCQMFQNLGVPLPTERSQDDAEGFCPARHFNCMPTGRPRFGGGKINSRPNKWPQSVADHLIMLPNTPTNTPTPHLSIGEAQEKTQNSLYG